MNTFYEQRPEKLFIGGMTRSPYPAHIHLVAELVIVTRGSAAVTIDGVQYALKQNDAAVIFPLVPHSYDILSEDSDGLVAIFPTEIIPEYAGTFHGLQPEYPILPAERSSVELRLTVDRLSRLSMEEDLPLCIAYLHVLLACVLHKLSFRPVYSYSEQELGYRIIHYITGHAFDDITLETASHALGISPSHLSRFFSEQLHSNFRGFINSIRIEKARMLMRDPAMTLTEICDLCGYANMRTFRRAFLREVGCLPSEHLAGIRKRFGIAADSRA